MRLMDFPMAKVDVSKYPNGISYENFKVIAEDQAALFKRQDGRFYVLLCLDEAEHMRSVLHQMKGKCLTSGEPLLNNDILSAISVTTNTSHVGQTMATMWCLNDSDALVLGTSCRKLSPLLEAQHKAMVNSYRFMNSAMYFDDTALMGLFRVLYNNTCEEREAWWSDIRACRRRMQIPWDQSIPVGRIFTITDEYMFLEYLAVVERIRLAIQEKGMYVFDAFRAFNSSNSGLLTCSELYGAVEWLGIKFTPNQIYDLVRRIAVDNEGLISYVDFKRTFHNGEDDIESRGVSATSFGQVPPKPIPELCDVNKVRDHLSIVMSPLLLMVSSLLKRMIGWSSHLISCNNSKLKPNQLLGSPWFGVVKGHIHRHRCPYGPHRYKHLF